MDNPKDGLFIYGPIEKNAPKEMRVGVIGTSDGIQMYKEWVTRLGGYIPSAMESSHHSPFPGFQAVFGAVWSSTPIASIEVSRMELRKAVRLSNRHDRVHQTVSLFADRILEHSSDEEVQPKFWFVVIPDDVYRYCRPLSVVPKDEVVRSKVKITKKMGRRFIDSQPSLFNEDMDEAEIYKFDVNFHHQLKARLLNDKVVVQIVRESTISKNGVLDESGFGRRLQDEATVAWNLATTAFFKSDGRPWKLSEIREGVCYIGLVFKVDERSSDGSNACCGAQMFLDSGDGLVFKLAKGKYYSKNKEFHLPYDRANELMTMIVREYEKKRGCAPKELFIHGRTRFNTDEWQGFQDAVSPDTRLVGVKIIPTSELKVYRPGKMPVLRGTAFVPSNWKGYLWTRGYIPRLMTYPGREVPNPLLVEIVRGEADIHQVLSDVLSLTKVNFNACIYGDGLPVTLRFANAVGEILTAAPGTTRAPLPFKHYI